MYVITDAMSEVWQSTNWFSDAHGGARGGRASGGVFSGTDPETFSKFLAAGRENQKIGLYSGISVRPLAPLAAAQEISEYYPIF